MDLNFMGLWQYRQVFIHGIQVTLLVSSTAIVIAIILGTGVALMRLSNKRIVSMVAKIYVEAIRNTPILIQLYIIYFGIGSYIKYKTDFWPGVMALAIFSAAFVAEIIRSGIQAVPHGQVEAGLSIGMDQRELMRYVVLPQAFRKILPPLAGQFITLIKDSSLVSLLALSDLTFAAQKVSVTTFRVFESYIIAAALYFAIATVLSHLTSLLERKVARSARS